MKGFSMKKEKKGFRMGKFVLILLAILIIYLIVQAIICHKAVSSARKKISAMPYEIAELSYGNMTYIDEGHGEIILSLHGLYGGFDQGFNNLKELQSQYELAPSRFGYLGSSVKGKGSPKDQAEALVELLDYLEIDKVFVFGTSAGGTPAIRFAIDYPDRCKGLILYSSASPAAQKPTEVPTLMGPPDFLNNDYTMWILSPFFPSILSMESDVIYSMLPIADRRVGANLDASITNPDMLINFDDYPIENLQIPVFVAHAKDDATAKYETVALSLHRYPNLTTCIVEEGGHLMEGQGTIVKNATIDFIEYNK